MRNISEPTMINSSAGSTVRVSTTSVNTETEDDGDTCPHTETHSLTVIVLDPVNVQTCEARVQECVCLPVTESGFHDNHDSFISCFEMQSDKKQQHDSWKS